MSGCNRSYTCIRAGRQLRPSFALLVARSAPLGAARGFATASKGSIRSEREVDDNRAFKVLPAPRPGGVPTYAWIDGVPLEQAAADQLSAIASLPIVHSHVAVMPDVHMGKGATVGSVIPTVSAIVPAAVGVDIGCGMAAVRTSLRAEDLPTNLKPLREAIEAAVPHGRTNGGGAGDKGAWGRDRTQEDNGVPRAVAAAWKSQLQAGYSQLQAKHPKLGEGNDVNHLGTLGTGNHFIEVCLDEAGSVWVMLHSGSRGVGNRIGTYFIEAAKKDIAAAGLERSLPPGPNGRDLAYLREGTPLFDDYVLGVSWAQSYARLNRKLKMDRVMAAMAAVQGLPPFVATLEAVNCHHNYVQKERHFGQDVWLTRKGALSAKAGEWGIIPGSMGACSYIVQGKGNAQAFSSCSHGAGRVMSRGEAKRRFTLADHVAATAGIECRKDADVIDETPAAYKDIDAVMAAQADLVQVVHTLRQVVCVKG